MSEITLVQVIGAAYGVSEKGLAPVGPPPSRMNTALLLIDIQQLSTADYMAKRAIDAGLPAEDVHAALADYKERFEAALSVSRELLAAARQYGIPPIHVRIAALSGDARDTGMAHRMLNWYYPPESEGAQFLPECAPRKGEIALSKTVSSAFTGTGLDHILRHMGIHYLFLCGFVTDECVETAFRDAIDHGYLASIVSDATTTYFVESYAGVMMKWGGFGLTPPSQDVIKMFASLPEK